MHIGDWAFYYYEIQVASPLSPNEKTVIKYVGLARTGAEGGGSNDSENKYHNQGSASNGVFGLPGGGGVGSGKYENVHKNLNFVDKTNSLNLGLSEMQFCIEYYNNILINTKSYGNIMKIIQEYPYNVNFDSGFDIAILNNKRNEGNESYFLAGLTAYPREGFNNITSIYISKESFSFFEDGELDYKFFDRNNYDKIMIKQISPFIIYAHEIFHFYEYILGMRGEFYKTMAFTSEFRAYAKTQELMFELNFKFILLNNIHPLKTK